jgi:hypothetical protein
MTNHQLNLTGLEDPSGLALQWLEPIKPILPISSDSVIEIIRQTRDEIDISVADCFALFESRDNLGSEAQGVGQT